MDALGTNYLSFSWSHGLIRPQSLICGSEPMLWPSCACAKLVRRHCIDAMGAEAALSHPGLRTQHQAHGTTAKENLGEATLRSNTRVLNSCLWLPKDGAFTASEIARLPLLYAHLRSFLGRIRFLEEREALIVITCCKTQQPSGRSACAGCLSHSHKHCGQDVVRSVARLPGEWGTLRHLCASFHGPQQATNIGAQAALQAGLS
jgi:hypothetical protein